MSTPQNKIPRFDEWEPSPATVQAAEADVATHKSRMEQARQADPLFRQPPRFDQWAAPKPAPQQVAPTQQVAAPPPFSEFVKQPTPTPPVQQVAPTAVAAPAAKRVPASVLQQLSPAKGTVPNVAALNSQPAPVGIGQLRQADEAAVANSAFVKARQAKQAGAQAMQTAPMSAQARLYDPSENVVDTAVTQQAAASKEAEWRRVNQPEIDRQTQLYRDDIQKAKTLGGDPNQWIAEFGNKAAAGMLEPLGAVSDTARIRVEAARQAAEEAGADRGTVSKFVQNTGAGLVGSLPEMGAMALGAPAIPTFAVGGGVRAAAQGKDVYEGAGRGALSGAAFEVPVPGGGALVDRPVASALARGATTGAATTGLELAQGEPLSQALQSGVTTGVMSGGGQYLHAPAKAEAPAEPIEPHHSQFQERDAGKFSGEVDGKALALAKVAAAKDSDELQAAISEASKVATDKEIGAALGGSERRVSQGAAPAGTPERRATPQYPSPTDSQPVDVAREAATKTTALTDIATATQSKDSGALATAIQTATDHGATPEEIAAATRPSTSPATSPTPPESSAQIEELRGKIETSRDRGELNQMIDALHGVQQRIIEQLNNTPFSDYETHNRLSKQSSEAYKLSTLAYKTLGDLAEEGTATNQQNSAQRFSKIVNRDADAAKPVSQVAPKQLTSGESEGPTVADVSKIVLEPPNSILAKLTYGKETPIDTKEGVYTTRNRRGKEYKFDLHVYRLEDGRERLVLSAGDPTELVDAGAVVKPVDGGVVIETLHKGVTGFDNLGGVLTRQIVKRYGKIVPDTDAPLSPAGRKATEKLAARTPPEVNIPERPETLQSQFDNRGFALDPNNDPNVNINGATKLETPNGTFHYDPAKVTEEQLRDTPLTELLNHVAPKSPESTQAVVTRNADGSEYQSSATKPSDVFAQVALSKANAPEGGTVESGGSELAQRVLEDRVKPPDTTSARKAQMAADRAALDLPELPDAERKGWEQSRDNAVAKGLDKKALAIADDVLKKPHALNDEETAGLALKAQEIKNDHAAAMDEISKENDPDKLRVLRVQTEQLQDDFDKLSDALKQSGTEKGRALASQKLTINQDYDLVSLKNRYKQVVGKAPEGEALATIERQASIIKDLQDRIAEHEARTANDQVSRATEKIRRDVARETRQSQRGARKADLDSEADQLKAQIAAAWKKVGKASIQPMALDPEGELTKLVLKLARNRLKANVGLKAEALVDEVHGLLKDVTDLDKRRVAEIITNYGRPRKPQSPEQQRMNALKSELRKGLEAEDIAAGKRSARREGPTLREGTNPKEGPQLGPKQGPPDSWPARKRMIERQITELDRKAREKDFAPKPKRGPTVNVSAESQRMQENLNRAKFNYERKLRQWENENRSMPEKVADLSIKWHRFAALSHVSTLGKLSSAAVGRMITSPIENATSGELIHLLRPGLSAKATTEGGGYSHAAEVAALWKSDRMGKVLRSLMGGGSNLDLEQGSNSKLIDKEMSGEGILGVPGRIHGAMKEWPRQAEYDRAFVKVLKNYEKQGIDITQPHVQLAAKVESFAAAERARFQQRNFVSDWFNKSIADWEKSGKIGPKVAAKLAKFEFPITRVPVNVAGEALNYAFGVPHGIIQDLHAMRNGGLKNMTAEQANTIVRAYKKGGVGLGLAAYVLAGGKTIRFGGYFQKNDKRDPSEPGPGEVMVGGHRITKGFAHFPLLEVGQMAQTALNVGHRLTDKGETAADATYGGAGAAAEGLAGTVPFYETPSRWFDSESGPRTGARFVGEQARSMIPGFVQEYAKARDTDSSGNPIKRSPEGSFAQRFGQTVETGVPLLRERVPVNEKAQTRDIRDTLLDERRKGGSTDLDALKAQGKITEADKEYVEKNAKLTARQQAFGNAQPADALTRYERMDAGQRSEVKDAMARHAQSLLNSKSLTDEQKAAFKVRLDALGIQPLAKGLGSGFKRAFARAY